VTVIRERMRANGSPEPVFDFDPHFVQVTLTAHPLYYAARAHEKGLVALAQADFDEARALLARAGEVAPDVAEIWLARGQAAARLHLELEARECRQKAVELGPRKSAAYCELALLEEEAGGAGRGAQAARCGGLHVAAAPPP
jgi:tetratricopeptide (TPR) repeat protein